MAESTETGGVEAVLALARSEVVRVYSGKPGCGCGCRGSYSTAPAQVTRVVNRMKKEAAAFDPKSRTYPDRIGVVDGIAFVESATRYLWAYTAETLPEAL